MVFAVQFVFANEVLWRHIMLCENVLLSIRSTPSHCSTTRPYFNYLSLSLSLSLFFFFFLSPHPVVTKLSTRSPTEISVIIVCFHENEPCWNRTLLTDVNEFPSVVYLLVAHLLLKFTIRDLHIMLFITQVFHGNQCWEAILSCGINKIAFILVSQNFMVFGVKVKLTLEYATKAQRGSRWTALLILQLWC